MEKITSLNNPYIKQLKKIKLTGRAKDGLFLVEGLNAISSLLSQGAAFETVLIDEKRIKDEGLIEKIGSACPKTYMVSEHIIPSISDAKSPQGIVAFVHKSDVLYDIREMGGDIKSAVVLENLADPQNVGAIMRTCDAMGVGLLVAVDGAGIFGPRVLRASAGSFFAQKIAVSDDIGEVLSLFSQKGFTLYASTLEEGSKNLGDVVFKEKCALVIGNEDLGITKECADLCDEKINIPMKGGAQSLNAAGAAAILIWEMVKSL